ncbi:MAG TPA: RNA polymerase Rpb4 family protein [Methanosarcinaceae archaeon]|nr:RNA polymerase Rpb4 family protein [Methanosarcinaceae archaeon]
MIVKEILNEELLTLSEVKETLNKIMEERSGRDEELGYELRKAISHADMFAKSSAAKSRELVNKLNEQEKMKPEIAVRLTDIMPRSRDELRTVYAKERYTLSEEELDEILDLITSAIE